MSKKGKLRSIHIEPAQNGYSVRAHHDMSTGQADAPMGDSSQPMVFQKKKHVIDHVSSLLGDNDGDEAPQAQMSVPPTHPVKKLQRKGY